jgi:hypothetical protein
LGKAWIPAPAGMSGCGNSFTRSIARAAITLQAGREAVANHREGPRPRAFSPPRAGSRVATLDFDLVCGVFVLSHLRIAH